MSIKYEFHVNPPKNGEEVTRYHPRMISSRTVDSKKIAESLHAQSSLSTGDVQAVLSMLGKEIVSQLSYNNRVHINGVGYFYLSLKTKVIESDHEVRAESIKVKKLILEADEEMKENLKKIDIRRSEEKNHSKGISDEETERRIACFFIDHPSMTGRQFQSLSGMTERTAQRYIKKLVKDGILKKTGHNNSPLYTPGSLKTEIMQ